MRTRYLTLAIAAAALTATAAFAQDAGSNPARRQGDVFQYGPMSTAPTQSLTNPFSGNTNPLSRNTAKPRNNIVTPVPEPSQWAMMLAGLALVGFIVRRNSKRS